MNAHITKEEFAEAYANNYEGAVLSDLELENAVNDYNGRVDNFLDALFEDVLADAREGGFNEIDPKCCKHDFESACACCMKECPNCPDEEAN
jgi:phospholipase/lecithinase/hemolysin